MKYVRFKDIPKFTRDGNYSVDVDLRRIPQWIEQEKDEANLNMLPEFQRGHVWSRDQQIAFIEFMLRGGKVNPIYFNCPSWRFKVPDGLYDEYVCVDGLQRITAICAFIHNEITAFGSYFKDFEDPKFLNNITIKININDLKTEKEVLQWYLDINTGGTPHTELELSKVKHLLDNLSSL